MAQRIIIARTCDVAGEDVPAVGTYEFVFQGDKFSIDLGEENAKLFEAEMTYWSSNAQKDGSKRKKRAPAAPRDPDGPSTKEIRAWAKDHGYPTLGDRGRVSQKIRDEFAEALVSVE